MFPYLFLVPLFLCWGSFLNVVAHRLLCDESLLIRSRCPACKQQLAWYHLFPVLSWFFLRGHCAFCAVPITFLYPFIELLTALSLTTLWRTVPAHYFLPYFLLFSALLVCIRTDLEHMLLLTYCTLGLIPVGIVASACGLLPLSVISSIAGALVGGGLLWLVRFLFWKIKKQEGMGWGDIELLAGIGSFVGPLGVLIVLLIGSLSGSVIGLCALGVQKNKGQLALPFGAFLALGAMVYVLASKHVLTILLN
jgi:leader peptidase (prepilin peptidase)/N-methyltransferase